MTLVTCTSCSWSSCRLPDRDMISPSSCTSGTTFQSSRRSYCYHLLTIPRVTVCFRSPFPSVVTTKQNIFSWTYPTFHPLLSKVSAIMYWLFLNVWIACEHTNKDCSKWLIHSIHTQKLNTINVEHIEWNQRTNHIQTLFIIDPMKFRIWSTPAHHIKLHKLPCTIPFMFSCVSHREPGSNRQLWHPKSLTGSFRLQESEAHLLITSSFIPCRAQSHSC